MLLIWANFFGRSRMVVVFFLLIILSLPAVIGVLSLPLPAVIVWFLIGLWIFAVIFVLPAAIYMIDYRKRRLKMGNAEEERLTPYDLAVAHNASYGLIRRDGFPCPVKPREPTPDVFKPTMAHNALHGLVFECSCEEHGGPNCQCPGSPNNPG